MSPALPFRETGSERRSNLAYRVSLRSLGSWGQSEFPAIPK